MWRRLGPRPPPSPDLGTNGIFVTSSEIDVVKLLKSMIELLIEASEIDQDSRIIEIESGSDSDPEIEEISTSNMKGKEVGIDNQ